MSTTQDLIDQQGWSDETLLMLYDEFIARMALDDSFADFLNEKAALENCEIDSNSEGASRAEEK